MCVQPPPPSPTCSEPPPSYDSLSLSMHPPPTTPGASRGPSGSTPHPFPSATAITTTIPADSSLQQNHPHEASNEELDSLPPPYSPMLRAALETSREQYEGKYKKSAFTVEKRYLSLKVHLVTTRCLVGSKKLACRPTAMLHLHGNSATSS